MSETRSDSGCNCVGLIVFILFAWALLFGLPINNKTLDIDVFPPAIKYR